MKKLVFLFVLAALLAWDHYRQDPQSPAAREREVQSSAAAASGTVTISVAKEQIYKGNLVLINKEHPVRSGNVEAEVVNLFQHKELVKGFGLLDNSIRLPRSLVQSFTTMIDAARKDGVNHFLINSGYRNNSEQKKLYAEMGANYALPPGYSEHNLGLSLDIGSSLKEMNDAPEGAWLTKHAWDYGFILRYPKHKTAVTGIQYEPWHFRYVGLPHSVIMRDRDLTLEQYLDYVKASGPVKREVNGTKYEITYVSVGRETKIQVPAKRQYELSGNNIDGVIVTVRE